MRETVSLYGFEDEEGASTGWTTRYWQEAEEHARRFHLRVIEYKYEYADSSVVADFTATPVAGFEQDA